MSLKVSPFKLNRDTVNAGITPDIIKLEESRNAIIDKMAEKYGKFGESSFIGTGRQPVVGSVEGNLPLVEDPNYRQVYSQTPVSSVIIKKRVFSSLKHLYNPIFMDPAEKWLIRATKKLIERKCMVMAEYEKLMKIAGMIDMGLNPAAILANLSAADAAENWMPEEEEILDPWGTESSRASDREKKIADAAEAAAGFDTYRKLENIIRAKKPASITTYYIDPFDPELIDFGLGQGVFEITTITDISTDLGLSADGGKCSFSIEDPNRILFITDEDIEFSIIEASPRHGALSPKGDVNEDQKNYVRNRLRLFYLGKCLIQPMDEIHIYIDGGTRRLGIGESVNYNIGTGPQTIGSAFPTDMGSTKVVDANTVEYSTTIDDTLLEQEFKNLTGGEKPGTMSFAQFKKIRTLQLGMDSGSHVFAGLVTSTTDRYSASNGKYTISVSGDSNMQWLRISRFNKEPSLDQTEGLVNDPLTPFQFKTDPATGLPIGRPELLPENENFLSNICSRITSGAKVGKSAKNIGDLQTDVSVQGGRLIELYDHVPGLQYRWKQGIQTATYNHFMQDPKNLSLVDTKQLRRDMGFYWSNSAFDNMDAANIISILVSGIPYNASTFIQSSKTAFIPNSSINSSKDYFSTFLDFQSVNVKINGNFIPFKTMVVSQEALAQSVNLQIQLTGRSSELQQLRTQHAEISDKIDNFEGQQNGALRPLIDALISQRKTINIKIENLITSLGNLTESANQSSPKDSIVQVAGNDVMFDTVSENAKNIKNYGDRLLYLTQRRREDVVFNKDKNLLIISDEYDKDYDIQAFMLQLRQQSPDMFKSTWADVHSLCKIVADVLDFEFFVDTQGHIVFRPPQYNKTPLSVIKGMLSLYNNSGIKLFSDQVFGLYSSREESILRDVSSLEWEIALNASLLGYKIKESPNGYDFDIASALSQVFIINDVLNASKAFDWSSAKTLQDRTNILNNISKSNAETQLSNFGAGLFSASAQFNIQTEKSDPSIIKKDLSDSASYNLASGKVSELRGIPRKSFEEFDKVKVGATRNGQSTPSSDISKIVTKISTLVSQRARLLRTLERVMMQINEVSFAGSTEESLQIDTVNSINVDFVSDKNKLIEDDTKDYIGYMSGKRFIIKNEHILSCDFTEQPPEWTTVTVRGGEPILGIAQNNDPVGTNYIAFAADFDLWRQYGFRTEKTFDKPFFSSAELQCAPYAMMLLSRQRKNIVTGNITVIGNEFYQLGDVVYIADRRLLYYVSGISHSFSYGSKFETTLKLTYGHPPGEYIATPLDIIGKSSALRCRMANTYRVRRLLSNINVLGGVIQFNPEDSNNEVLKGKFGVKNFNTLVQSGTKAKIEGVGEGINDPKVFVVSYTGDESVQQIRRKTIKDWFSNPEQAINVGNSTGKDQTMSLLAKNSQNVSDYKLSPDSILSMHINQCEVEGKELTALEKDLIYKHQNAASQESFTLDNTLENVIEIRIVRPPDGGWKIKDGVLQVNMSITQG